MKICVIGTGYVGLVSGVCFADLGNIVHCVDIDIGKINKLNQGSIPIFEPGLDELVKKNYTAGRLKFSTNLKDSVFKSDIIFICVGTPTKKNVNAADLSLVYKVTKEIKKYISDQRDQNDKNSQSDQDNQNDQNGSSRPQPTAGRDNRRPPGPRPGK